MGQGGIDPRAENHRADGDRDDRHDRASDRGEMDGRIVGKPACRHSQPFDQRCRFAGGQRG